MNLSSNDIRPQEVKIVSIDAHPGDMLVIVLDEKGGCVYEKLLPTSAEVAINTVELFSGEKLVVMEESNIAGWLVRELRARGHNVLVADPVENAWIARDENIDDERAAMKLAELTRAGLINPVHHPESERKGFKEVVMSYRECAQELARAKNKLNSHFCSQGIYPVDRHAYKPAHENLWLLLLDEGFPQFKAELLLQRVQYLDQQKQKLRERMEGRAGQHDEITRFMTIPGMGLVRSCTFFTIIDTPERFANESKMCSYCGLGIARKQSDQTVGHAHLTRKCNPHLKDAVMGAARAAIRLGDNKFARSYRERVANGKEPHKARADVARSLVRTLRSMWIHGEEYDDDR